ncbi:PKD domain-containing protein [Shimia biformata]|uniref:PKD domain-containing protein n=1 Tax=Shimia biformata TaxID=1294299 RepID=UPI001EF3CA41|nr:PKD domain-containing protein [Shimia biformata]
MTAAGLTALPVLAQNAPPPQDAALMVVYGVDARSREGDTDHREQVFFSVPEGSRDRLYVRVFDPDVSRDNDFLYGGAGNARTVFRVVGGNGAYSAIPRPTVVENGARATQVRRADLETPSPGEVLREQEFGPASELNGQWVTLGSVRPAQGEAIDGRLWFRIDVIGAGGNDGNGFSLDVSLARERSRRPEGLKMLSYEPTIRWPGGAYGTRVDFTHSGGALVVQNFDGAAGDLRLNNMYDDLPLSASGQDVWASSEVTTEETNLSLTLRDGFEVPNDVTMRVFDGAGDALPLSMPPYFAPAPERPTATATATPLADCSSVAFDASTSLGSPLLGYSWLFGDGATSDEAVIAHSYAKPGRYEATLRVLEPGTGPARGAFTTVPVHVRNAPVAVAGAAVTVAPGDIVSFDGSASIASDSPITRFSWNFGDGTVAEGATAEKAYAKPGQYRAVLRVGDDSRHPCNFGLATRPVTVNHPPVAEAGTDLSVVVGQTFSLSGAASYDVDGEITDMTWDLGDGTALAGPDVTHKFDASGSYRVVLTVRDNSGVSNAITRDFITIDVNAPPEPRFTTPDRALAAGEAAVLDATGSTDGDGNILSYLWEFGDGAIGEGDRVEYAWAQPGTYPVTLTVVDDSGTPTATQSLSQTITINAPPVAEAGPDQFLTASDVQFDGRASRDSDGAIARYDWDFGDGHTGTGPNPRHAYARPGVYNVALRVTDDSGAPQSSHRDTMRVTINALPIADAGPSLTVTPGQSFTLDGSASVDSDGSVAAWEWVLPDGTVLDGERVSHAIAAPGIYRIRLTVFDDFPDRGGRDEAETFITVNAPPVAVAGPDLSVAPGQTVLFSAAGSNDPDGSISGYRWEFDDLGAELQGREVERAYDVPGVFNARLVVTDDSGVTNGVASDEVVVRVNHAPIAEAGEDIITDQLLVTLDASGSGDADGDKLTYTWDFGDGSGTLDGVRVTHAFPRAGKYPVTLRVSDGTGLANGRDVDAMSVTINARPMAVAGGNRDVCSGEPVLFDASASSDPDGETLLFSWDFGDGETSTVVNPNKIYELPGTYPVTLTVQDESGTEQGRHMDRIAVLVREGPIAMAGEDKTVCVNQPVRFDGTASTDADGSVNGFDWSFGDGGRAGGAEPLHSFSKPGEYRVTLTITGDTIGACSPLDTDTLTVTVLDAPTQEIDAPLRAALGNDIVFSASLSGVSDGVEAQHRWTFPDGSSTEGDTASHAFAAPGAQLVTLETTLEGTEIGCGALVTQARVIVNEAPVPLFDAPAIVAAGQTVAFDAGASVDPDGAITGFQWDFGDGNTGQGVTGLHVYSEPGDYEVTLTVTDAADVENSQARLSQTVTVNPAPMAALATPAPYCPGETRTWAANWGDGDISWAFGDGKTATGATASHSFANPGLFPVSVRMDDGKGQLNSVRMEEVYARINAAPVAEAGPDRTICPGDEITFSALTHDPDGTVTAHEWVFSDGVTLNGPTVTRRFDTAGAVDVRLTVTDDSGSACASGSDSARILVNAAPLIDAGPDRETLVGAAHDAVRFDAGGASDPDGHGVSIGWAFGDGANATGAVARHAFAAPGDYLVTVTARDSTGLTCGIATDTVRISASARDGN